ncbi:hypothetical protein WA026_014420 [Henosepilachna vigintioctopunctata]|uniref:Uncharacterized protein n=1 Tax=Henosepilachna vigintioctopunctata TaxID=420089 RepID=A0AAW1UJR1_9CUCU
MVPSKNSNNLHSFPMNDKLNDAKSKINEIQTTVEELDKSLSESRSNERKIRLCSHVDRLKSKAVASQLDNTIKDNAYLLNILQNKCDEENLSRNYSNTQLTSSLSTMSMVHLQYKYEELLTNHNGLLKMLEKKMSEIRSLTEENEKLREETEIYKFKLEEASEKIEDLNKNLAKSKSHQELKLNKLNIERDTLKTAHKQLVTLLHDECMKNNEILHDKIKDTHIPERAQLLKEVQTNNILIFENIQLRQQNEYLKALLKMSKTKKKKVRMS